MEPEKRPASVLGTLRTAVNKVRFLLSFSATRWILSSIAGRSRAAANATTQQQRRLSFGSRRPSLLDAEDDTSSSPASTSTAGPSRTVSLGTATTVMSRTSSAASSGYSRSASSGSAGASSSSSSGSGCGSSPAAGDQDIDRRAEQFIANFYKHIQMERQVSLQLRYCRMDSLQDRTPSPTLI